jgi:hypothetical protein
MFVLPGFDAVSSTAHDTGDCAGFAVTSGEYVPCSDNFLRFGRWPSAIHWEVNSASTPSNPSRIVFGFELALD